MLRVLCRYAIHIPPFQLAQEGLILAEENLALLNADMIY
jgi:hypothetical protein